MSKKKKNKGKGPVADQILRLLERSNKPLPLKRILRALGPGKRRSRDILDTLQTLEDQGALLSLENRQAFILTRKLAHIRGTLELTSSGAGFVLPEDKQQQDIFISQSNLGGAWPGDRVSVALLPKSKGKNPEGRVLKILERNLDEVLVVLEQSRTAQTFLARSVDASLRLTFEVDTGSLPAEPNPGDVLMVDQLRQVSPGLFKARARDRLGPETEVPVQESIVKVNHRIPRWFSAQALQAAEDLPDDPQAEEIADRQDLRELPCVTIDGEDARDFDDAVCVQQEADGFRLLVAIADVSHYIRTGSPLDQEAGQRGNSFYFPCSVEPMFPEKLSAGLCSLVPDCSRLVMAVDMDFNRHGRRMKSRFYPAVIRSRARLTYRQVKRGLLEGPPPDDEDLAEHLPMLRQAADLAAGLRRVRKQRGALDFDLPEPEWHLDSRNRLLDIQAREHSTAHQMIEEFMLAANEAVAEFLVHRDSPCLFRIHPEPDQAKIEELFELLSKTGLEGLPRSSEAGALQGLLHTVAGGGQDFLVNRLLLRTLMQAAYATDNQGHFGLASDAYCHFTSPIRRYADLVVHRLLKTALGLSPVHQGLLRKLSQTAEHLNTQERKGVAAEREIGKRLLILLLKDSIGERFTGIIASVGEKGFWVEFRQGLAEGFVRLDQLPDDQYELIQEEHRLQGRRTGQSFQIGDQVRISVRSVSLARLEIDLGLED
jgi:ribonuclease R